MKRVKASGEKLVRAECMKNIGGKGFNMETDRDKSKGRICRVTKEE